MAGNLSSSNRSQLVWKLEGTYPTNFGVTPGGNGTIVSMLSESLNYDIQTVESKIIRADRQRADSTQVSAKTSGGYNSEHIYREHDPFIQAAVQADFVAYGTNGVGAAIPSMTASATTLTAATATTGADNFTNLERGQWFTLIPPANASASVRAYLSRQPFRVSRTVAPTSTVITLDPATPYNTALAGPSANNFQITTSRVSNGVVMKSYSLEVQHLDIARYRTFRGQICSKMDVSLTTGDIVSVNFEFLGDSGEMSSTSAMGTPVAPQSYTPANATRGVFDIIEGDALISATTYIKTLSFMVDNTLRDQKAVGVFGLAGIGSGTHTIGGKLSVYFANEVLYNKFVDHTSSSLSIPVLDNQGNGYVYFFPFIRFSQGKVNVGGQDQDNMVEVDFNAYPDPTVGSPFFGRTVSIYRVGR